MRRILDRALSRLLAKRNAPESPVGGEERVAEAARTSERRIRTLDNMLAGCQLIGFDWRYKYVNEAVARQGKSTRESLIGRTMMECYPGIEETDDFKALASCMHDRTPWHIENEVVQNDGSKGWFELSIQPVPEGIFIVSIDVTERKLAEMHVWRQLSRLQSLRAIDLSILGTTEMRLALKTVLQEACARLEADTADVRLFNPTSLMLELIAPAGTPTRMGQNAAVRLGSGVCGKAALERRTIAVPDLEDPAVDATLQLFAGPPGTRAIYSTPLVAKGKLIGTFDVTFLSPYDADADWLDFFEAVAGQAAMTIENGQMFEELQRTNLDLQLAYDTTIEGWSRALDLRDKETEGHTQRVTEMTVQIARLAGMSEAQLLHVKRGALLHDIGKMGVPDGILLKPGKLTDDEWVLMRKHTTHAYDLLKPIEYLREALDIPLSHHEKWDGTGYPRGLKREEIPLAARLFAVADVWDAIRYDRPYRAGWPEDRAIEFIRSESGKHFDPLAVELFLRVIEEQHAACTVEPALTG